MRNVSLETLAILIIFMTIGDLIHDLPKPNKDLIRSIEQTRKKLVKCAYALAYNKTCINEDILPKWTNIYI